MLVAPIPPSEEERVTALRVYGVLDTDPEQEFDDVAWLAAEICGTPMAFVSLVDADREFFKAAIGSDEREAPRDVSFCGHTILTDSPLILQDTREDERFKDNPQVVSGAGIRFYAGVPLVTPEGYRVGALCVKDTRPRTLSVDSLRALQALARQVVTHLETRRLLQATETAARQLEESHQHVRASEALYRQILNVSPDMTSVVAPDGTIRMTSASVERCFGFSEQQLVGHNFLDFVVTDDRPAATDLVAAAMSGEESSVLRCRVVHSDGRTMLFDVRVGASFTEDGTVDFVVANLRDVTDEVALEERLQQSQRLEAIGRLAGGVAHDFNNLLTAIQSYGDLAARKIGDGAGADELAEILTASTVAADLTAQLLAFGRRQVMNLHTLDLAEPIRNAETLLRRLIPGNIDIATSLPPCPTPVRADHTQIEQVVINLGINAAQAMPTGGTLTIGVSRDAADNEARLTITDTGAGMDALTASHIFEPFFTTKGENGSGLGLSIVHGIIGQTGGTIQVESEPGEGTTFTVTLPLATTIAAHEPDTGKRPARTADRTDSVLLVEDNPAVRDSVAQLLQQSGFRVTAAGSGEDAIALAQSGPSRFDLLITDMILPAQNGRETAEALQRTHPQLKVLYMSGYTDDIIIQNGGYQANAHFLQKPFSSDELLRSTRDALAAA